MVVSFKLSALAESRWYEYAVRFLLGGIATALAGAIAAVYGPVVGGLFLAFPAIFPASATLVEKHQREKKEKAGIGGSAGAEKPLRLRLRARQWAASVLSHLELWSGRRFQSQPL